MAKKRQKNWFVPLRVRFRSPAEQEQWEREHAAHTLPAFHPAADEQAPNMPLPRGTESPQRTQQIKELIRLGNILRAELGFNEVLQQIIASISACTGFRGAVINLVKEGSDITSPAAFVGGSEESDRSIRERPLTVEQMHRLMRPQFRISQSYFIPHEYAEMYADLGGGTVKTVDDYEPGGWHPEDMLIVPLFSPRQKKLLGVLSLDDPEDGKIPTVESIEMLELFANQAAIAIDNARIFDERDAERVALEEAIALLLRDLERVQRGEFRVPVRTSHEKVQRVVEAINVMIEKISEILGSVQMVTQAVDEHAREVQRSADLLVRESTQQQRQIEHISPLRTEMAGTMKWVAERADKAPQPAKNPPHITTHGPQLLSRPPQ